MYPSKPTEYNPSNEYYSSAGPAMPPPAPPMAAAQQYYPPAPGFPVTQRPQQWSTGLCACGADCGNCCMTCWCPCVTFGRIAEIVDQGTTSCGSSGALYALLNYLTCCHWIYSCSYRSKLRAQFNLVETPCNDCLLHCCCESCALCQEYRELKNRGFDVAAGWHGNMQRGRVQEMAAPPVMQGGMMR